MSVKQVWNLSCPQCDKSTRLKVQCLVVCLITEDGTVQEGDTEWDNGSHTVCDDCGFEGPNHLFHVGDDDEP